MFAMVFNIYMSFAKQKNKQKSNFLKDLQITLQLMISNLIFIAHKSYNNQSSWSLPSIEQVIYSKIIK